MITRLCEVCITVKDFHSAVRKYSDVFGITPIFMKAMKEKPKEEELPRKRARAMQFSHGGGPAKIETVKREGKKVGTKTSPSVFSSFGPLPFAPARVLTF
jgi:hypothetical protein